MSLLTSGVEALRKIQLGFESTAGTAVATTFVWRGSGDALQNTQEVMNAVEMIGVAVPTERTYIPRTGATFAMAQTPATFEQLPILGEAGMKADKTGTLSGTGEYAYAYDIGGTAINTINTFTVETGDNQQAYEAGHGFITDFTISANAGEALQMAANWALRAMSKTTFTGSQDIPPVEEILANKGVLYIDNAGGIGGTAVTGTLLSFTLTVGTGWTAKWTMDNNQLDFEYAYFSRDNFNVELQMTYEHNTTGVAEYDNYVAGTPRAIRLRFDGSTIAGGGTVGNKRLDLDVYGVYTQFSQLDAQDGNSIVTATLQGRYDPATDAKVFDMNIVNTIADLSNPVP